MARAVLYGISVSTGIAIGKSFFLGRAPEFIPHELITLKRVEVESARLQNAINQVIGDFEKAKSQLPDDLTTHADVLDSHLLICKDPKLNGAALRHIRQHRMNAEWAVEESVAQIAETFSRISSPYIQERMEDVRLVANRIIQALLGKTSPGALGSERGVLLAHDLTPADVIGFSAKDIFSFAIELGGKTSHTGILARSLSIPAVVGVSGLCRNVENGDLLIVDALRGIVLVEPSEAELAEYLALQHDFEEYQKRIWIHAACPAETEDGQRIAVLANIESGVEAEEIIKLGGEGVGLVRTEFGYLTRAKSPEEEELSSAYMALAQRFAPSKVTFRTLDLGAEKFLMGKKRLEEPNPALGLRAIRYCLRHQHIFRTQLRAILRASVHGNVAMMFPLISGLMELRLAKSILNEARQELAAADVPFDQNMPVGIMVELPSAVFMADVLAREVDFFSIGTNDLIQYTLGVDRNNKHVAQMHHPLHPAIVRAIKQVADMAHKVGIPISVCGEMAADPYCLPILLGMSVDELSLAPQAIPAVKHLIRRSNAEECRKLLNAALAAPTTRAINNMARQAAFARFPEDVPFFVSQLSVDL